MKKELSLVAQSDSVIISLQRASTALAEAKTIQHTKKIIDVSAAAEIYAKRQHLGEAAVAMATSIKVEALRKLGEMLKATPRAKAFLGGTKKVPTANGAETLAELGIDKKTSSVAQALANLSDEAFEEVREGNETVAKAIAKIKEQKAAPVVEPVKPVAPEPVEPEEPEYTELDAAHDQISGLQDQLAAAILGEVSEDDKDNAKALIESLRERIKTLEATLKAVTTSRDTYMNENAELRRQITRQRKEIDKITGRKTA